MFEYRACKNSMIKDIVWLSICATFYFVAICFGFKKGNLNWGISYPFTMYIILKILRNNMLRFIRVSPKKLNLIIGAYLLTSTFFSYIDDNGISTIMILSIIALNYIIQILVAMKITKFDMNNPILKVSEDRLIVNDIFSNEEISITKRDIEKIVEDSMDDKGIMVTLKNEACEKYEHYSKYHSGKIKINTDFIKEGRDDIITLIKKVLTTRIRRVKIIG